MTGGCKHPLARPGRAYPGTAYGLTTAAGTNPPGGSAHHFA